MSAGVGMRAHNVRGVVLGLAVLLGCGLLGAGPAFGAMSINGYIGGPGGINEGGVFTQPRDVAVWVGDVGDPLDDKVFVVEATSTGSHSRVQRLDVHGNFELAWGRDAIRLGAPGDTGLGFEVCRADVSGAESCQTTPSGSGDGELRAPMGIAVDQGSGDVFVRDRDNFRVQQYTPDGVFVREWGGEGSGPGQFAASSTNGTGIAVDPVSGNIFAADPGNRRVQEFTPAGVFVDQFGSAGSAVGEFGPSQPLRLAVDSSRVVYVSDSNGSGRVQRYDAANDTFLDPIACCDPDPGAPLIAGNTLGLEVDPDSDGAGPDSESLLVLRDPPTGDTVVQELEIPAAVADSPTVETDRHVFADSTVNGLGVSPTSGYLYVAAVLFGVAGGGPFLFDCESPASSAAICQGLIVLADGGGDVDAANGVPADVGARSATLSGTVTAGGGVAGYRFQVFEDGQWRDIARRGYASGDGPVDAVAIADGLDPNTLYRSRLVADKHTALGEVESTTSEEVLFLTDPAPPDVQALGSTARTDRSAVLRGRIDPNGSATSYRFEYGTAVGGSFDQLTPIPDGVAGAGNTPQLFTQAVDGLVADTEYMYRLVATNPTGTTVGDTVTFRTQPAGGVSPPPGGRAFELVSPAYKTGGVGVGSWYRGPASGALVGAAAYDGERFLLRGVEGSVLIDSSGITFRQDWAGAQRTAAGWAHRPLITRGGYGDQQLRSIGAVATQPDLSLIAWGSSGLPKLFAEMEGWPSTNITARFASSWDGAWETFAPLDPDQYTNSPDRIQVLVAADVPLVVGQGTLRGVGGPSDPTSPVFSDWEGGQNVYGHHLPDGPSDTFAGTGVRALYNVCTGSGASRTMIPLRGADGSLGAQVCPGAGPDRSAALISPLGAALISRDGSASRNVVSADGRRVFLMSPDPIAAPFSDRCEGTGVGTRCAEQLFVREQNPDGSGAAVSWISRPRVAGQAASLLGPAVFEGASADGGKVFFRTNSPLTADDPNGQPSAPPAGGVVDGEASSRSWDLYMHDLGSDELVRISGGPDGQGDCNSPFDGGSSAALRLVSDDGSLAYFACAGPLEGVGVAGSGTITDPAGSPADGSHVNIYAYDHNVAQLEDRYRFVARVPRGGSGSDVSTCASAATSHGDPIGGRNTDTDLEVTANVNCWEGTADGRFVTFWTDGRLVADDPDESSADVYAYDHASDELIRVSAPQGGVGGTYACGPASSAARCYGDGGFGAGDLPALGQVTVGGDGSREVFFQSASGLVAGDVDGRYDVYRWRDGELSLLSPGTVTDTFYVGNDRTGQNVYLATRDRLTWQDTDAVLDVYSARVGGGIPQPPPPPVCDVLGDRCRGAGAPAVAPVVESNSPGGENAAPGARERRLRLAATVASSRRARARAARTGVVAVRVRVSKAAVVRVGARARLGGRVRRVGLVRRRLGQAGTARVRLRLARPARKALRRGRPLRMRIVVRAPGARGRAMSIVLRRPR